MPRIELIPDDFDESTGDGTPIIDVCRHCAEDFVEGDVFFHEVMGDTTIGSTDVAHPTYDDDAYRCHTCDEELDGEDN